MGIDEDLVSVLRDLVQFLETLCDVDLPNNLENLRSSLLRRSRSSLAAHDPIFTSPEPYLDMNAGKGKGLVLPKLDDSDGTALTEYIDADSQPAPLLSPTCQNDYESFGIVPSGVMQGEERDEAEEKLRTIYRSFSAEQTRSKSSKCGPLHIKDERRFFMKSYLRSCFIGLVGTHLLIYSSQSAKQPTEIISIRDYSARSAPNSLPRDPERAKSAFEVYSPGNKTLQFIARVPKDMEQWVAAINRMGCAPQTDSSTSASRDSIFEQLMPSIDPNFAAPEEEYQDVEHIDDPTKTLERAKEVDKTDKVQERCIKVANSPTSNPPPLPARIPRRLPSLPQEPVTPSYSPPDDNDEKDDLYHTIEDLKDQTTYQNLKKLEETKKAADSEKVELEMYDDIQGTDLKPEKSNEKLEAYVNVDASEVTKNQHTKEPPKKKSFFTRVKPKKESHKKEETKKKSKVKAVEPELPTYDDVFEIAPKKCEDLGNYTCPPAPRPVFIKPEIYQEEVYDDIAQMHETSKNDSSLSNENCEMEHYQVPRSQDSIETGQLTVTTEEELYDDIAILADFRARQRDSGCSSSSSERTVQNATKALIKRINDRCSRKSSEDGVESSVDAEDGGDIKRNKFQKLINKIEYGLNKSGKPPIPPIVNKYDGN